jgi:hypothetical protein
VGPRGLRRRRAVLSAVIAPTPSGVVARCRPRLRVARPLGVDDVARVSVLGLPARVEDPLPDRRAPWVGGLLARAACMHQTPRGLARPSRPTRSPGGECGTPSSQPVVWPLAR